MKNRSFPWAIVAAAAVAGAGFAGVANYVNSHKTQPVDVATHEQPGVVVDTNSPKSDGGSKHDETKPTTQRATKAELVNKALHAKNYGEFRVLNVTVEEKGNAIVDMGPELLGGMGSEAEADFIETLKNALAQFPEVKTFQIRIDGEIQKSLSHFEMLDPVPVR